MGSLRSAFCSVSANSLAAEYRCHGCFAIALWIAWLTARFTAGLSSVAGTGMKCRIASATEFSLVRSNGRRRVSIS